MEKCRGGSSIGTEQLMYKGRNNGIKTSRPKHYDTTGLYIPYIRIFKKETRKKKTMLTTKIIQVETNSKKKKRSIHTYT